MSKSIATTAKIQELAKLAKKAAKERFNTQLDYSEESLTGLDNLILMAQQTFDQQRVQGELSEEAVIRTSRIWGSYYGELIRKRFGGQWFTERKEVLLKVGDRVLDPIADVQRTINIHPCPSIIDHYEKLREELDPSIIPLPAVTETTIAAMDHDPYAIQPTWVEANASEQPLSPSQDAKQVDRQIEIFEQVRQRLKQEQSLPLGIAAGSLAGLVGSILWALITFFTEYQIGWMATGIGFFIGWTMRITGRGVDKIFGFAGATISLLSIILGNLLAAALFITKINAVSFIDVFLTMLLKPGLVIDVLLIMFSPLDLLFYILGLAAGYSYAFRRMSPSDLQKKAKEMQI